MTQADTPLYSGDIVIGSLGLEPHEDTLVLEHACDCSHCGRHMEVGHRYVKSNVGAFFMNTRDLCSGSAKICWRCDWLRKQALVFGMGATVATKDGLYPIHKDVNKAWFFTDPPEGPFVVTHSSTTMQHMVWRTPVTTDNRFIVLRYGPTLFRIRPSYIRKALEIADKHCAEQGKWQTLVYFDRKAQDTRHGAITKTGNELLSAEEIDFFQNLTHGERWALAYLMHSKRPVPEKPEPINETIIERINRSKEKR